MTDSFTAEMGSVQSLHKQHPTTNQTAHPSSSRVAYWDPKALTHRTARALGMPMELLPLSWSVASRFGRRAGGRNGLLLTQRGLTSHLEVQVRTQLCVISPP